MPGMDQRPIPFEVRQVSGSAAGAAASSAAAPPSEQDILYAAGLGSVGDWTTKAYRANQDGGNQEQQPNRDQAGK